MKDNKQFIDRINDELDSQVESLSSSTLRRLATARHDALDTLDAKGHSVSYRGWVPALTVSLFFSVITASILFQTVTNPEQNLELLLQTASIDDRKILDEGDDIELYQNLEFYYWLELEQANAS